MNNLSTVSTRHHLARNAIARIDEHLRRNRWDYDKEGMNRARRIVFGDAIDEIETPNNPALTETTTLTAHEPPSN